MMSLPLSTGTTPTDELTSWDERVFPRVRLAYHDAKIRLTRIIAPEKLITHVSFLDFLERTALENGAGSFPRSIRELPMVHRHLTREDRAALHLICERWGQYLGERNLHLILNVFLGRVEPRTAEQEQAVDQLHAALMEYVDESAWKDEELMDSLDEWRFTEDEWGARFELVTSRNNDLLWRGAVAVLRAWGMKIPRHYSAPLAYDGEGHFPWRWNVRMDGPRIRGFHSPMALVKVQVDDYLLRCAEELRDALLGKDPRNFSLNEWGLRRLDPARVIAGAFSGDELALLRNMGEGLEESPEALMALAPHLPYMTWSSLLELAVVANEYNIEWAIAAKE